jgi:hypothetical protein
MEAGGTRNARFHIDKHGIRYLRRIGVIQPAIKYQAPNDPRVQLRGIESARSEVV